MTIGERHDECLTAYLAYDFDYQAVESVTGFDRLEVMASINDFDNKMSELGIMGYLELGYILTEAIVNVISTIHYDGRYQQLATTDYFTLLSDILSNEEEFSEGLDDVLTQAADLCFRVHNFFVIGFSAHLDYNERCYLATVVYPEDKYEMFASAAELTEDAILLGCGIPKEYDENEDILQQIHADLVARINRRLSSVSRRSGNN